MSWIKTLWLWKEVALCLLLGLSLVWGHMWWIAGVLVPAAWDGLRCPLLIKFFRPMFYSGMTAWTQRPTLWLAVPVPIGESGPAGPGGQGLFKEQDTKTCDPGVHSFTHHALRSKWHIAQIFFYSTAFSRTSLLRKQVVYPSGSKSFLLFLNLNTPTVFSYFAVAIARPDASKHDPPKPLKLFVSTDISSTLCVLETAFL